MTISYHTLGCKLNWAETDSLKKKLKNLGYSEAEFLTSENVAVIRACGVTETATHSTLRAVRQAKSRNKVVIVCGCSDNISEADLTTRDEKQILEYITNNFPADGTNTETEPLQRTRAFVKIQDGCAFQCAYCTIPHFRGRSISLPHQQIIDEINNLISTNYREIVLTGVNVLLYNDANIKLSDLVKNILEQTKIERIRFGSIDPRLITAEFVKLFDNPRVLPHLHLSLQSGSNNILTAMNRHYTAEKYLTIIKEFRNQNPHFSFTTDVIVGFPGETETDHDASAALIEQAEFLKVHLFPFSARPNTVAANLPDQISESVKKDRLKRLEKNALEAKRNFAQKFIGTKKFILFEHSTESQFASGYTPEYIRIRIPSNKDLANQIREIQITKENLAD